MNGTEVRCPAFVMQEKMHSGAVPATESRNLDLGMKSRFPRDRMLAAGENHLGSH